MAVTNVVVGIAAGASLSNAVTVSGTVVGIELPSTWVPALLSFAASPDGGATYNAVFSAGVEVTVPNTAPNYNVVDPNTVPSGVPIKVRSGTVGAPVNQIATGGVSVTLRVAS